MSHILSHLEPYPDPSAVLVALPCHRSLVCWPGKLCKLGQNTTRVTGWRLTPQGPATGKFRFIDLKLQQQLMGVDGDGVALLDQSDRAAIVSFRRNVPHYHAPGSSG